MKHSPLLVASLLSCLVLVLACSGSDPQALQIASELPSGTVPQNFVVEISFSRGVVPPESTNVWTSTPYIEFTPPVEGKFVWQDTARLVFSTDAPWPGATEFRGRLHTDLLKTLAQASSFQGKETFSFSTEQFFLKSAEFFYDRIDNNRTVGIKANLEFTYLVNPEDITKYLQLNLDGQRHTTFTVMTSQPSKLIPVEMGTISQLEKNRKIEVSFDSDLTSPETNTRIFVEKPFAYELPGLEELKIYGHEIGFDGKESWVKVRTSQEVDISNAREHVSLEPARTLNVEPSDRLSFLIKGKLEPGTPFHLTIKKGLGSVLGAKMNNDYTADVIVGNIKPSFKFASAGSYLLLGGSKSIEVKTINLSKLNVRVHQVFQNNIVFFLDQGRYYDYSYYYEEDEGSDDNSYRRKYRYNVGNYGRMLETKSVEIPVNQNQEVTTTLDLASYLRTDYKGFLVVDIADPSQAWRSTSKLVSMSDIGLIVKKNKQEVNVFAVSLVTNGPMSGVKIDLVSHNNQVMASAATDADGLASFKNFTEQQSKGFSLKLVTASKGEDFNFINLSDYRVETSRFDVGGKYDIEGLYDAFLYGDRNLYRPGEKIFVSGIVRNLQNNLPENMPVKISIYNPKGTLVTQLLRNLNEQGSFEISHQTQTTAQTGEYRFDLLTGNDLFLASYKVSVEDFVPDRLKVNLTASKESARPGETVSFHFQALNFFGPPAAGRNYEFEGSFIHAPFLSKRFREFRFSNDGADDYTADPVVVTQKTDAQGEGDIDFAIPEAVTSRGVLKVRGRVGVFDESGRPVYQLAQTTVYPKEYFLGVQYMGYLYVAPNSQQKVRLVVVDPNDNPIKGFKARVELIRREWHSVLRMHPQTKQLRYVSEQREIPVDAKEVVLGAEPTEYTYVVPPRSGDYLIRVLKAGEEGYNQFSFYSYSWGTAESTSFEIDPEARVDIVLDKKSYEPGERAKVLFQTPFNGKMLVTIERNKVFSHHYLNVEQNTASLELPIEDQYLPNVYISAVLFRNVKDLTIPLMAGHGFAPLPVEKKTNLLNVQITAPEKIRPRRKQTVTVTVPNEKDVFVTLAAVDEGICQIKNYATPDPYGHFYAKKALETETFDFFRDLLPEPEKKIGSAGGGDDASIAKRANPLGVQRFKPVALWSGILKTNSDGNADVTLDIPEFSGEVRLMALAYKNNRFGYAAQGMKIADPIVITPALPRFLSPEDQITMPITAFNTTEKPVELKFTITTEGPLVTLENSATLELKPNQERFVNVTLKASDQIGKAVVIVKTEAFGEELESKTELPVRPASPYVSESTIGFVDGGKSIAHNLSDVFLPYGRTAYLTVSPFPVANFAKELKYLVGYPHGCLEQTTSKAFPQIYLRDIALLLDPSILDRGSPTYFVNEAIAKISTMQQEGGAFTYWPGGSYYNDWSTVYATHFLVEAKKAGYAVPEATLSAALNALTQIARNKRTMDYRYRDNNRTLIKRIADKSAVYALYVLALAGQPELSVTSFYRTTKSLLTHDTQYLLAGAYALSGDRKTSLELFPQQFASEEAQRTSGGWFDSPIRANAIILNVLLETDPNNLNIPRYMDYLVKTYRSHYWYSTQDNAFTLLAFGKAARKAGSGTFDGIITIDGKQHSYTGGNQRFDITSQTGSVTIHLNGEGRVYYSLVMEGIRKDGNILLEDKNLRVRREFFDRFGNPLGLDAVKQNSLAVVKLTVETDVDHLENVAITDLLPGGFEIENPRLTETTQYEFVRNASVPEYVDIRDDRINYYTNFHGNKRKIFYYMVRAVTKGEFYYAPISAEAMYDGNYYSAHGRATIRITD